MKNKHYINSLYVLTLLSVALLWRTPYIAFACLATTSLLLLKATRWKYTMVYLFCAAAGSISEIIAIAAGAWHYAVPQIGGIPIWLPLAWGCASILFMQLSQPIKNRKHPRKYSSQKTRTNAYRSKARRPRYVS